MDDLSRFCCQNPECPDYGRRGSENLSAGGTLKSGGTACLSASVGAVSLQAMSAEMGHRKRVRHYDEPGTLCSPSRQWHPTHRFSIPQRPPREDTS